MWSTCMGSLAHAMHAARRHACPPSLPLPLLPQLRTPSLSFASQLHTAADNEDKASSMPDVLSMKEAPRVPSAMVVLPPKPTRWVGGRSEGGACAAAQVAVVGSTAIPGGAAAPRHTTRLGSALHSPPLH